MPRTHHTSVSGQKEDVEECLIGLGQPADIWRLLYTFLPLSVVAIVRGVERDSNPKWSFRQVTKVPWPAICDLCKIHFIALCTE